MRNSDPVEFLHPRLEVTHVMQLDDILELLAVDPDAPIELDATALLIARDEYPDLDVERCREMLDRLADAARPHLGITFETRVEGLCRFLFREAGFSGNQSAYYDPRNSYLNDVLDRRTGIPITLSLLAMAVGERLGIRIRGVALPGHFVAMADEGRQRVVFDPFDGGRRLSGADCEALVRGAAGVEMTLTLDDLAPAAPGTIILRMLMNLKGAYVRAGDFRRAVRVLGRLRQIAPTEWVHARDLGACLLQCGFPGRAIDAFQLYLKESPGALDKEAVEKQLTRARDELARWN